MVIVSAFVHAESPVATKNCFSAITQKYDIDPSIKAEANIARDLGLKFGNFPSLYIMVTVNQKQGQYYRVKKYGYVSCIYDPSTNQVKGIEEDLKTWKYK